METRPPGATRRVRCMGATIRPTEDTGAESERRVAGSPASGEGAGGRAPIRMNAKVCLVGESGVGKTSLIRRFVLDTYGDTYIKTIGTKITRREVLVFPPGGRAVDVNLVIWDIMGDPGFRDLLQDAYFQGARGVLAVADVTRAQTLPALGSWIDTARGTAGSVPVVTAVNKADLVDEAEFGRAEVGDFARGVGVSWLATSAKTGENVPDAFRRLAVAIAASPTRGAGGPATGEREAPLRN